MNGVSALFTFLLTLSFLTATVLEDAEDKKSSRWHKVDKESISHVVNYFNQFKRSRVIAFKGEGTKTAYLLKNRAALKKRGKVEYMLSWEMNFSEDFVVFVTVETTQGDKILIYTPGVFQSYMLYGLGLDATNGEWHEYRRDLQKDIGYYDNRCRVLAVKNFVIRGEGEIDNVVTSIFSNQKNISQKIVTSPLESKKVSLPTIELKGDDPLYLEVNETYIEPGVRAYDREDGELEVVSMERIDTTEEGRYSVVYMAKNSQGNSAILMRHVIVGEPLSSEEEAALQEGEYKLFEQEEIAIVKKSPEEERWDRELQKREEELKKEFRLKRELRNTEE